MRIQAIARVGVGLLLLWVGSAAHGHGSQSARPSALVPAERILGARDEIGLSADQLEALEVLEEAHRATMAALKTEMAAESKAFLELVGGPRIDETTALEAVDRIADLQRRESRARLGYLIRLRTTLSEAQWAVLVRRGRAVGQTE